MANIISDETIVYEQVTGLRGEAESTGGGTYARAMDNAVAYGPGFRDPQVDHHAHNADEFVGIDEMVRACKVYAHTILALQDVSTPASGADTVH